MASRLFILKPLLITLFAAYSFSTLAGTPISSNNSDSLLQARLQHCRDHINEPGGLALCDTLYTRAVAAGDKRIQVQALCLRLERFYYLGDEARIIEGVRRVQSFCDANPDTDLRYFYYFVWSGRLIAYYIRQNKTNVAVYETQKMLESAKEENYPRGIAAGYQMLANIYFSEGAYRAAYDNFHRQAAVFETNNIDDINLPMTYGVLAECALKLNMPDSAALALQKGDRLACNTPYQRFALNNAHALYSIYQKNFPEAKRYVNANREMVRENSSLIPHRALLYELEMEFYKAQGAYPRALEVLEARMRDSVRSGDVEEYMLPKLAGDIHWLMGDMASAAIDYRDYIRRSDSVRMVEALNTTNDFSDLLEIERLRGETKELYYDVQQRRLRNTYLIMCSLAGLLLLGGAYIIRMRKFNRQLRDSEARIKAQNDDLRAKSEQLERAKQDAEQLSRMKTDFIQNMSHEVRTPLNSIVGFSQVLASQFRADRDTREYAAIIEQSSTNLLRLIDDALDIASLDSTEDLPRPDFCEMNNHCRECLDKMLPDLKPGVTMVFESSPENPKVRTNAKRIKQVLLHLLHNAAKFTEQGQVTLGYQYSGDARMLRFVVSDTGQGIPPDQREQVFERFVKLDSFSQGTGLGLSICRVIADKLGGRLYVDPEYKHGCRMILEVPLDSAIEVA